jgi:F420-0:gamma-glutamyl ligase
MRMHLHTHGVIVGPTRSGQVSQGTMGATIPWYQSFFVDREEGDRDQDDEDHQDISKEDNTH